MEGKQKSRTSAIVGIGASAGGLEALEAFLDAMPSDSGLSFVLVVHLDPKHISILPELLQKHTAMPVCHVDDGVRVDPDHVYVIPPNRDLSILNGALQLMERAKPRSANMPIDSFFRSLAQDQKSNAVGIILSGTGTDGTLGVKAIKSEVGMVMVQDEESSGYDGMPRSAIATGLADYVLAPSQMPEHLVRYTLHSTRGDSPRIAPPDGPGSHALQKIFVILRSRSGQDFSHYKKNTICRRIERRMNVHQFDDITDYVRYLQSSEREASLLFKELLIGVTNFFRDPEAFDALRDGIVSELLAIKPEDHAFRVWIPGCASGEEAYSVAIMLQECMEKVGRRFHVQIFGTDIDPDAIEVARAGIFPRSVVADVGTDRIKRFFTRKDDGLYKVKQSIRETLVFAPQNVIKDPPFTKLDILCCRNLLIYMEADLQQKLLPIFHYSLNADGILFLGSSETIGQSTELFTPVDRRWKIFRKRALGARSRPALDFTRIMEPRWGRDKNVPGAVQRAEDLSVQQLVETVLQQSDAPPCAIVDDAGDTAYIHGRTGMFLEPAAGKASLNIVEMARPGLKDDLASAIHQVAGHKREVVVRGLKVDCNGKKLFLDLTVKPILKQISMRGLMMVVFEEVPAPATKDARRNSRPVANAERRSIEDLEDELRSVRESLQTSIEEFETSSEELRSSNEELQSTNEELETSKEELQSLNEESVTVNVELQARIDELSKANDDMKNLLDSTNIATIFLDTELRIRRFTPRATDLVPVKAADVGRPLAHLASRLPGTNLQDVGVKVLEDLSMREAEVESEDGRVYAMKARPYRTAANVIDGVVITFDDITGRKLAEKATLESEQLFRMLFDLASDSIVLVASQTGRFAQFNRRAYERLGYGPEEFANLTLTDIETGIVPEQGAGRAGEVSVPGIDVHVARHRAKDGTIQDVRVRTKVITFRNRSYILSSWHDITPVDSGG